MAVNEKVRIRLKSYEHTLVDAAAAKIVEIAKRGGAEVSVPFRFPRRRRSSRFSARCTSTRTAVSSSNSAPTHVSSRSRSLPRLSSILS